MYTLFSVKISFSDCPPSYSCDFFFRYTKQISVNGVEVTLPSGTNK